MAVAKAFDLGQPAVPRQFSLERARPWIDVMLAAVVYGGIWASLVLAVPIRWYGFMDGYFYQLFMKTFQPELIPTDYNSQEIPAYPFYGFYLIGKLGNLVGVTNPSRLYLVLLIVGSSLALVVGYLILRQLVPHRSALLITLALIVWPFLTNNAHMFQKPHELFAQIAAAGIVLRLSMRPLARREWLSNGLLGLLAGFIFGEYLPVVVPAAAAAAAVLVRRFTRTPAKQRSDQMVALAQMIVPAAIVALPQAALLIEGLARHHQLPTPEVYFADEFVFTAWVPWPALAALVILTVFLLRRNSAIVIDALAGVVGVLALYAVLCVLNLLGRPYPVAGTIPSFAGLLWLGGLLIVFARSTRFRLPLMGATALAWTACVLIALQIFLGGDPQLFLGGDATTLANSVSGSLTLLRDPHLRTVVRTIDANHGIRRILANHRFRFAQLYTDRTVWMTLPFSEGLVSRYDDFPGKFTGLQRAASEGTSSALLAWLDRTGTDTIILDGLYNSSPTFEIDLLRIPGFPHSGLVDTYIYLPKVAAADLVGVEGWQRIDVDCGCLMLVRSPNASGQR